MTDNTHEDESGSQYWHGGAPGIPLGKRVRPAAAFSRLPAPYVLGDSYGCDPTRVYITSDQKIAIGFVGLFAPSAAAMAIGGTLYRVEPIGEVQPDPDFPPAARSFTCKAATVVEIAREGIRLQDSDPAYLRQFSTWDDGSKLYDDQDYALPSPQMRGCGITKTDLRRLGPGPSYLEIVHFGQLILEERGRGALTDVRRQPLPPGRAFGLGN